MKVWVDQYLCTGDALCADVCPEIFFLHDDGSTYRCHVKPAGVSAPDREQPLLQMERGQVDVPPALHAAVIEAAEDCPGACIFVEP